METFTEFAKLVEKRYLTPVEEKAWKWQKFLIEDLGVNVTLDVRDIKARFGSHQPYIGIKKNMMLKDGIKTLHVVTGSWENNPEARQEVGIFITEKETVGSINTVMAAKSAGIMIG